MKKKRTILSPKFIVPVTVIAAAGLIFACTQASSPKKDPCAKNVARLQEMESADISQTEKALQELKARDVSEQMSQLQDEISKQSGILDNVTIRQVFEGTVIIGDSITESIVEYGFLDTDVVISQRGLSVANAGEQISTAIGLHPTTVFMAFGSNDLELYGSDSDSFIAAYRSQVQKLQEALPDSPIYINGILPPTDSAIAQIPELGYYEQYNQALQVFCEEMGCTFIDNSFILDGNENMYEPDGEHVVADFYPQWLTYMAETAGLYS